MSEATYWNGLPTPAMRGVKRLYRLTATYPDGRVWTRHYQSANAAKERRGRLMDLVEVTGVIVTIERSDPVTFPSGGAP